MKHKALVFILVLLALVTFSYAQQNIVNDSFESFPFSNWTNNSVTRTTNPHNGSYAATFNANADYIYTAQLAKPGNVTFWGKCANGGTSPTIKVQTSTDASDWTDRLTQQMTTNYTNYSVDLSSCSNVYVRFYRSAGTKDAHVDDVNIALRAPSTQVVMGSFTNVTSNSITINWTNGNGDKRVVFVKQGSGSAGNPTDGTNYTPGTDWANKQSQLASTGYYCVYNNTGTTVTVTNLSPNTAYYVAAYEYNTSGSFYVYKTTAATGNTTTSVASYTVEITSDPTGADILVGGSDSSFDTPHTFDMDPGTSATYSVSMTGYTFEPEELAVNNISANTSQEFTGTLIPVPVVPADTPTDINGGPLAGGVAIETEIDLYDGPAVLLTDPVFLLLTHQEYLISPVILSYDAAGTSDVTITVGEGSWYGLIYYGGNWHFANIPDDWPLVVLPGNTATMTFLDVNFGAKGDAVILLNDGDNPLPVEFSSFSAVLSSQYFVELHWSTQSETEALGFYVYRNNSGAVSDATCISPLIQATNTTTEASYTYTDIDATPGTWYYWLQYLNINSGTTGHNEYYGPISINVIDGTGSTVPPTINTLSNFSPNPFNPMTTVLSGTFGLSKSDNVNISIYNLKGEKVRTLLSGMRNSGNFPISWNGRDDNGRICTSGVYYFRMNTGDFATTKKIIVIK